MSTLGETIRYWREKRGLTMYELSRQAAIQTSTLSVLEQGKQQSLRTDRLQRIADVLGVTVDELMQGPKGVDTSPEDGPGSHLEEWVTEIVAIGPRLTPSQRVAVLEHARALQGPQGR